MLDTPSEISSVATITKLRSRTTELIEEAQESRQGVLISKRNTPYAVLVSIDRYHELLEEAP